MTFLILAAVLLVVVTILAGVRTVPQSQVMVIERLGKYHRVLESGLNIVVPMLDKGRPITLRTDNRYHLSRFIDLREQVMGFDRIPVITRDNVAMEVGIVVYSQVIDAVRALYEIENLSLAIDQLAQTNIRNVIGSLSLDETLTSRETLNTRLRVVLDEATGKWGVKVTRVELKEVEPPPEIKNAMARQMTAERERRARVTAAEGDKSSKILEAEGAQASELLRAQADKASMVLRAESEKTARILEAEAQRDAAILVAEGRRQAASLVAEGEAAAIRTVYAAIHEGKASKEVLAVKYLETLEAIAAGPSNKIFIPYEATALLAALGGLKDALADSREPLRPQLTNQANTSVT